MTLQNKNNYYIKQLNCEELLKIYRDTAPAHFPADELKPVYAIEALLAKDAYLGLGLFDETERILGYALFLIVPEQEVILLDYYAIFTDYRDLGLGSFFLQEMRTYFKQYKGIFIETEDIDCASNERERLERTRRNEFYTHNGAISTNIKCTLFDVSFTIWFLPTDTAADVNSVRKSVLGNTQALQEALDIIYRFMLPPESYAQNVTWR